MICWSFSKSFSNASLFKQKICRTVHPPAALQRCQCSQHPGVPISSRQLCADRRQKQLRLRLHVGKDLRDTINRRLDPSSRFKQVLLSVSPHRNCWFFSQSVHALKTPRSFLESVSLLQSQTPYHLGAQKRQHALHRLHLHLSIWGSAFTTRMAEPCVLDRFPGRKKNQETMIFPMFLRVNVRIVPLFPL